MSSTRVAGIMPSAEFLRTAAAAVVLFCGFLNPLPAEKISGGWGTSQSFSAAVNPVGLELASSVFYTVPLFPEKTGILWDSARLETGLKNALTPAYDAVTAFLRIEPAAFFQLYISADVRCLYDALGFGLTPLMSSSSAYDSAARKDAERKSDFGLRYVIAPTFKGALGNVLGATTFSFVLCDMRTADTGNLDYYYEPSADIVLKTFDGYIVNDTALLYRFTDDLFGGVTHMILFVPASGYVSERIAFMGYGTKKMGEKWKASLALLGGTYLQDSYNTYRDGKLYLAVQLGGARRL